MSDTISLAVIAALSGGTGAFLQFITAHLTNAANIDIQKRQEEREAQSDMIKVLQAEIVRISAERDKYLDHIWEDTGIMNEAAKVIKEALPTGKETPT